MISMWPYQETSWAVLVSLGLHIMHCTHLSSIMVCHILVADTYQKKFTDGCLTAHLTPLNTKPCSWATSISLLRYLHVLHHPCNRWYHNLQFQSHHLISQVSGPWYIGRCLVHRPGPTRGKKMVSYPWCVESCQQGWHIVKDNAYLWWSPSSLVKCVLPASLGNFPHHWGSIMVLCDGQVEDPWVKSHAYLAIILPWKCTWWYPICWFCY